ncbi:MAG: hypothetical protein KatS3mg028_1383 [Bacteroidia bacterium]|nr:MAG: hypothetical protein KatS3mg028_1383 [Bacteroidia bacterium]
MIGLGVSGLILIIDWNSTIPAYYYRKNGEVKHEKSNLSKEGSYVFVTDEGHPTYYQVIDTNKLLNKSKNATIFTFGVWVWGSGQAEVPFARIEIDGLNRLELQTIRVSETPVFFTSTLTLPEQYRSGVLRVNQKYTEDKVKTFWDCFILIPGDYDLSRVSSVSPNCEHIRFGTIQIENLIRNPSAEKKWFPLREPIRNILSARFNLSSADFWSTTDPLTNFDYFQDAAMYLYRTFWGRFNWGTLPLAGNKPYRIFLIPTIMAIIGIGLTIFRFQKKINWSVVLFFLIIFWGQLIYTLFRFAGDWDMKYLLLPQARYFFPAVFAAGFFLCSGWYSLVEILFAPFGVKWRYIPAFFSVILLVYNLWAWLTICNYWYL